jgi:acetyltransferase EpsM
MKNKKVLILGGMGTAGTIGNAIYDARQRGNDEWEFCGYLNDREEPGTLIENFPVMGKLGDIPGFLDQGYYFINTIYRIDGQRERIALFESLGIPDARLATFIHPMAYVSPNVVLGPGTVVCPNSSIAPGTKLGRCCLVMPNVYVGHNDVIGDHCHFASQACVGSYLTVGSGVHVGFNATIRENLTVGEYAAIGMGAVQTKNVGDREIWAGNPAKFIRMAE